MEGLDAALAKLEVVEEAEEVIGSSRRSHEGRNKPKKK